MSISDCSSGYFGINCTSECRCNSNHSIGYCKKENGQCTCIAGWTGATCDDDVDECTNATVCRSQANSGCHNTPGRMNAAVSGHTFLTIINVWKVSWDYPCDKKFPSLYFDVVYCRPLSCCFKLQMNVS